MAQIYGIGDPVNAALSTFFDTTIDFSGFGLVDRFEFKSSSIVHGDVSGTERASQVNPIGTSRALTRGTTANQPQYLAGGGPNGLTDALLFAPARPDGFALGALTPGTMTKVLALRPLLPGTDAVNMHLLSTTNSGNGRNAWFLRQVSGGLRLVSYVGDSPVNGAIASVSGIPIDTDQVVIMSIDTTTRTVSAGRRATGETAWTWDTAVYPEGYGPTVADHTLGARSALTTTDGFSGRISGALTFVGHDAHSEPALLDQINAWAFGDNSIFGL